VLVNIIFYVGIKYLPPKEKNIWVPMRMSVYIYLKNYTVIINNNHKQTAVVVNSLAGQSLVLNYLN